MTDTFANNDNWSDAQSLDHHIEYLPNWLRFDDDTELPNHLKTGQWKMPKLVADQRLVQNDRFEDILHDHQILEQDRRNHDMEDDHENARVQHVVSQSNNYKTSKMNKIKLHSLNHHYSCLPELRKKAVISRRSSLISAELDKGIYSLVERGFIFPGEDATPFIQLSTRKAKLPNLRIIKGKMHDANMKLHKPIFTSNQLSPGVKLDLDGAVKEKSNLFPTFDDKKAETSLPPNPCSSPRLSGVAKNRNIWNSYKNKSHNRYVLGRDTPDSHVLTGWVIPFKDGKVFKHAPGYQEFNARFSDTRISLSIEWIIQNIENMLQDFGILYADVLCEKILSLANSPLIWPLEKDDILSCIANTDEIIEKMNDPSHKFRNNKYVIFVAAVTIQRAFKRMQHLNLLKKVWASRIFQKYWGIKKKRRELQEMMKTRLVNESMKGCVRLINTLKRDWIQICRSEQRVIVQVCNWMRPEQAPHLPNYDFSRCYPLKDPSLKMIFICPFKDSLKMKSLMNLFDHAYRENNPIRQGRVKFLMPETISYFSKNTSMAAVTCISTRILMEIKKECEGKDAILYTDSVGDWDIRLSASLQIPLFGSIPDLYDMLSTKSKSRKFLEAAGIPINSALFSSASDITSLLANVIKAVYSYPKAQYIAFIPTAKLNLDYPAGHLPVAYINLALFSMKDDSHLESFAKSFAVKAAQTSRKKVIVQESNSLIESATNELKSRLQFMNPGYSHFTCFIQDWKESKGFLQPFTSNDPRKLRIIEYGFIIDVDGSWELIASTETIFDKSFSSCGFFVPQQQLSYNKSSELLEKISSHCAMLGMFGKFTLEIWTIENENGTKESAANNLKAYFSSTILKGQTVILASGCTYSSSSDKLIYDRSKVYVETKPLNKARFLNMEAAMTKFYSTALEGIEPLEDRVAFYQDRLFHDNVALIGRRTANMFFETHGLKFDYWSRTGFIFPGDEGIRKSAIPIISIQRDRYICLEKFTQSLDTTYSLLSTKKQEQWNTYQAVTERMLYELLLEKSLLDGDSLSFKESIATLDRLEISDIPNLISKYLPISQTRLSSPSDDDSTSTFRISTETIKLLAEGIPSNIEAEFDPTFYKPILLPPYKRQLKKQQSYTESTGSISLSKGNSID